LKLQYEIVKYLLEKLQTKNKDYSSNKFIDFDTYKSEIFNYSLEKEDFYFKILSCNIINNNNIIIINTNNCIFGLSILEENSFISLYNNSWVELSLFAQANLLANIENLFNLNIMAKKVDFDNNDNDIILSYINYCFDKLG